MVPTAGRRSIGRYLALLGAVWLALVIAAGVAVLAARGAARHNQDSNFEQRTRASAAYLGAYASRLPTRMRAWAQGVMSDTKVTSEQLGTACDALGFSSCGLFDATGRLLMNAPYFPDLLGQDFSRLEQVAVSLRTGKPIIAHVNVSPALKSPVVPFGLPYQTAQGVRVFTGIFTVQNSAMIIDARVSYESADTRLYVVDDSGNLAATTRGTLPAEITSLVAYDSTLASAVSKHSHGVTRGSYYSVADIAGTPWRLIATIGTSALYRPVGTFGTVALWALAGWALIGLLAILALTQAIRRIDQARLSLAAATRAHDERQRYAREVNDNIVQVLVGAEMAADLGRQEESRQLLKRGSAAARAWIDEQLDAAAPLRPGGLRRTSSASQDNHDGSTNSGGKP